jgi:hypothetical protein
MCLLIPVPFMVFTTAISSKVSDSVLGSTEPALSYLSALLLLDFSLLYLVGGNLMCDYVSKDDMKVHYRAG